ncbi:hypothetical protein JKP88DRAFT_265383 [Tribonema minus]|uniref:Uncharacterized protein n=1 Tax=Tribonema minus TaxID=303371 RepID=A0A835YK74_9STRA|nr:hypothetical protein JKP88DRAFT_265383 [Tribonema minus]
MQILINALAVAAVADAFSLSVSWSPRQEGKTWIISMSASTVGPRKLKAAKQQVLNGQVPLEAAEVVMDYQVQIAVAAAVQAQSDMATRAADAEREKAELAMQVARLERDTAAVVRDKIEGQLRQANTALLRALGLMHMRGLIEFGEKIAMDEYWVSKLATVYPSDQGALQAFTKLKKTVSSGGRIAWWTQLAQETDQAVLAGEKVACARKALAVYKPAHGPASVAACYASISGDMHDPIEDEQGRFRIYRDRVGNENAQFLLLMCDVIPVTGIIYQDGVRLADKRDVPDEGGA